MNHICFVSWAVPKNPKFRVFVPFLDYKKIEHLSFCRPFFSQIGLEVKIMCLEIEVVLKILQKIEKSNPKLSFWIRQKAALFNVVSKEIEIRV